MESTNKIANIMKLMRMLDERLSNKKSTPSNIWGDTLEGDSKVFSIERLMIFLDMSLSDFNMVPKFTNFSFEDNHFVEVFSSLLVEGAVIYSLGSQALLEKGREYSTSGSGVTYDPPSVSDLLQNQYSQQYSMHWNKLKYIKKHIRDFNIFPVI